MVGGLAIYIQNLQYTSPMVELSMESVNDGLLGRNIFMFLMSFVLLYKNVRINGE